MDEQFKNGTFMLGDCLERMREIPDGSVDMILCDLPYGTTQNKWDAVIPFEPLWAEYWRVAKPNAAVVLTAAQPFTSALVMSQVGAFRYSWVWRKSRASNNTLAKAQPLRKHEDVLVFCRLPAHNHAVARCPYFPQGLIRVDKLTKQGTSVSTNLGSGRVRPAAYFQEFSGYPSSVLEFSSEGLTAHPTQKPAALFEYLIRTYTNEGMTVLDNCAGSGTTAIAAERSNRRWICIERDPEYFAKACERVRMEPTA